MSVSSQGYLPRLCRLRQKGLCLGSSLALLFGFDIQIVAMLRQFGERRDGLSGLKPCSRYVVNNVSGCVKDAVQLHGTMMIAYGHDRPFAHVRR